MQIDDLQGQSKSVEERVQHLLSLMTTEEKVGQLTQPFGWQTYTNDQGNITLNESFKTASGKWGRRLPLWCTSRRSVDGRYAGKWTIRQRRR